MEVVLLQGKALERFAQMTNWDYYEAARRFQKVRSVVDTGCQMLGASICRVGFPTSKAALQLHSIRNVAACGQHCSALLKALQCVVLGSVRKGGAD